ncbi:MAG: pyruvate:ferredoxin (flavodoxin) oxidoreductase, partial [Spirochaetia bacterium]
MPKNYQKDPHTQPDRLQTACLDGSEAVARIAYAINDLIIIYPITPSTAMAELSDEWSSDGYCNIYGDVPAVTEMQSEAGVAGALHGALTTGSISTTFTSSQGLLLMIPNLYKIAGELLPMVLHVATRSIACSGLSMYCDHADVMACRQTGLAMLASNSPQEAQDLAMIAYRATFRSSLAVLHFVDGFRTSHEMQKINLLSEEHIKAMVDSQDISKFRARALDPEKPTLRGTAQNPDIYFAGREAINSIYLEFPEVLIESMKKFGQLTGRHYQPYQYIGAKNAEFVMVLMGSAVDVASETVEYLNNDGKSYGVLAVRLYRPFSAQHFVRALPQSVKKIVVLDRTKEPGSPSEPLCLDVLSSLQQGQGDFSFAMQPQVIGGRYGLGSFEFSPTMVKGVFDALEAGTLQHGFTVGIEDDLTHTSIDFDRNYDLPARSIFQALFYGLGSDGTVSANKNTLKIIEKYTNLHTQGYFSFEAKKAGGMTASHIRISKNPIPRPYLVQKADFVACHKFSFLDTHAMVDKLKDDGVFLLASPYCAQTVWGKLPHAIQEVIIQKRAKFYVIDAYNLAKKAGIPGKINVIMQVAAFKISDILDETLMREGLKETITNAYAKKGQSVIEKNLAVIDIALSSIEEVIYPAKADSLIPMRDFSMPGAPEFVKDVTSSLLKGSADLLPVSKIPRDGVWPVATSRYEKRNIAEMIPAWDPQACINCGQCSFVCPHAAIRIKAYDKTALSDTPASFKHKEIKKGPMANLEFTVQVAPEDCTGCGACINICPANALSFVPQPQAKEAERENFAYFLQIPGKDNIENVPIASILGTQLKTPLFEFSGACAGCGETPYIKLLTQLYGDHLLIANASGCSSVYGGYMPTVPYTTRKDGRGPAWSNSLFEDNAEFGLGMRKSVDKMMCVAKDLLNKLANQLPPSFKEMIDNPQSTLEEIEQQRSYVSQLKATLKEFPDDAGQRLLSIADFLVKKSVWAIGGDGWAYDIGYGGLDHVLASGDQVKVLVLDTEVYSNTGGQASKSTPLGALAKFANSGKALMKKPLSLLQSLYGYVYVAQINMGANMMHAIRAIKEAEEYPGPALVVAYSHCISHGINMMNGMDQGKKAVESGMWPLFRYNPLLKKENKNPFLLDSKAPNLDMLEE